MIYLGMARFKSRYLETEVPSLRSGQALQLTLELIKHSRGSATGSCCRIARGSRGDCVGSRCRWYRLARAATCTANAVTTAVTAQT